MANKFKQSIIFLVFSICLYFFQNYTTNVGKRYRLPVFNSIAGRVSKSDEYLNWFTKQGMPQAEMLKNDFRNVNLDVNGRPIIYKRYTDTTYTALFNWVLNDGKSSYQKFMLTHPYYLFLQDIDSKEICNNVFSYNLDYYPTASGFFVNAGNVFPVFNKLTYLIFVLIVTYLFIKTKNIVYTIPVILFILFVVNALLSYDADTLEIKRHLFITSIGLEFISLLILSLLINHYVGLIYQKKLKA